MYRTLLYSLVAALLIACVGAPDAIARSSYPDRIPNGRLDVSHSRCAGCAHCHVLPSSTNLNAFGADWNSNGRAWDPVLAAGQDSDSDGDGVPNGWELGDPDGTWQMGDPAPGDPNLVSSPGQASSVPPLLSVEPVILDHTEIQGENLWASFIVANVGGDCSGNVNGPCALAAEIAADESWMMPDPETLDLAPLEESEVDVLFTTDTLHGFYEGLVTVSAAGVSNAPQEVEVALTVLPEPASSALAGAALLTLAVARRRLAGVPR